jgi:hypothetical protein
MNFGKGKVLSLALQSVCVMDPPIIWLLGVDLKSPPPRPASQHPMQHKIHCMETFFAKFIAVVWYSFCS